MNEQDEIERLSAEVHRLRQDVEGSRNLAKSWQRHAEDARDCARWLRIVLTNMTQDEQMVGVYERWPWLNEVPE